MIKLYLTLTKPGIIIGNLITALSGFLLASRGHIQYPALLFSLLGIALGIASACVFNNIIDRKIDLQMERTKNRAVALGTISVKNAFIFALLLGGTGGLLLLIFTNLLTVGLSILGFFFYIVLYSVTKRKSIYGTHFGSVSGAVPPVVGYCAVTNRFDVGALLLFLLLVLWQMPHFYAIGIYRREDYLKAKIPALPVLKGAQVTKIHILLYIAAFIVTVPMLTVFHYAGLTYAIIMTILSLFWLYIGIKGFKASDDVKWARKMFGFSLIVLLALSLLISIDYIPRAEICNTTCLLK